MGTTVRTGEREMSEKMGVWKSFLVSCQVGCY